MPLRAICIGFLLFVSTEALADNGCPDQPQNNADTASAMFKYARGRADILLEQPNHDDFRTQIRTIEIDPLYNAFPAIDDEGNVFAFWLIDSAFCNAAQEKDGDDDDRRSLIKRHDFQLQQLLNIAP